MEPPRRILYGTDDRSSANFEHDTSFLRYGTTTVTSSMRTVVCSDMVLLRLL